MRPFRKTGIRKISLSPLTFGSNFVGRIDAAAETDDYVFIFEFKLDNDESGLSQVKEKKYYKQYELSKKKIFLNGVTFDTATGQIADWQTEEIQPAG